MKVVAIIPVKSTSSRISSKNIKLLGNKPLFIHTLEKLLNIKEIDEVWIDTDDMEIIHLSQYYGIKNFHFFIRDKKLADNSTNGNKLMENEILNINSDIYLQVLCTSPFLKSETIISAIDILQQKKYKSVIGVYKEKLYLWDNEKPLYDKHNIPNSNNLPDTIVEAMSLYGITKEDFLDSKMRIGHNPYLLPLIGEEIIDINYEKDFRSANKIAHANKSIEQNELNILKIKLSSCILSDLLNKFGFKNQVLKNYKTNVKSNKLFGRVRPIQIRHLHDNENENNIYDCLKSYDSVNYGDIIFVNNLIDKKAYFGDLNATIAISKNAQGTIINGYTRDITRINELPYSVFYKDNTCDDVKGVGTLDYYDRPIELDNITVYVNDLIFADNDGIIIIPREIENKIINECRKTIACESNIANSIICGKDIANIIEEYGTF